MCTPYLHTSLVDARIDDLRHSMAAARGRRSPADSRSDRVDRRSPFGALAGLLAQWHTRRACLPS